jgi:Leucine-rich repeat (LRR) protein
LQVIECENNLLSALDVSVCRDLGVLTCWVNQLTALDLSANANLSSVNCAYNQLACLNMGHLPLNDLVCNGNVRAITLNDSFLYLPNLPGFKPGKASNWNGGYVRNDTLYVQGSGRVTYQYDIGYDIKVEFALDIALASQQEAGIPIDEEHFPDAAFRSYVTSVIDSDASGTLSEAERNAVEALDLGDMGISSLAGLQHFPRLQGLSCANNQLSALDLSGNAAIIVLNCSGNRLTALDVSALSGLTAFSCAQNSLTALNLSGNPALQILSCGGNRLASLNVSMCPGLALLECAGNRLTSLDLSGNGALAGLDCSENRLAVTAKGGKLDLSGLPGFDPARASQWTGANAAGSVLTIRESGPVTYLYDCGRDVQIQFALDVTVTNLPAFDPAEELRNKPGNVNGDEAGTVDGRDVIRLARFLAGDGVQINEKAADVNADGTVDGRDLIRLARYLAGDGVELKQAP